MFGLFWWVFWIGHLLLGAAVPIALLVLWPRNPKVAGLAGLLIAALFISVRANIVIPGLALPELHGLERAFTDARLRFDYIPSLTEYLVSISIFVTALGVAIFFLGYRLLLIAPAALAGGASQVTQE
jgi:molybdopterin-containing oxidoreductase family membrane subunit